MIMKNNHAKQPAATTTTTTTNTTTTTTTTASAPSPPHMNLTTSTNATTSTAAADAGAKTAPQPLSNKQPIAYHQPQQSSLVHSQQQQQSNSSSSSSSSSSSYLNNNNNNQNTLADQTADSTVHGQSSYNNGHNGGAAGGGHNVNMVIPTKLYVTNFPFTCTQRQIQELFSQYGTVVECTLKKDYYAYIQYMSNKSALNAYKNANGYKMLGRKLTVHLATSKKSQSHLTHLQATSNNNSNTNNANSTALSFTGLLDADGNLTASLDQIPKIIHVRNFPETCSQQQIKDIFANYGDILECLILHDSYAFVHFKSPADARLALQSTNNQPFFSSNTNLVVQYSRSKFKQQTGTTAGSDAPPNSTNPNSTPSAAASATGDYLSLHHNSHHTNNNNNNHHHNHHHVHHQKKLTHLRKDDIDAEDPTDHTWNASDENEHHDHMGHNPSDQNDDDHHHHHHHHSQHHHHQNNNNNNNNDDDDELDHDDENELESDYYHHNNNNHHHQHHHQQQQHPAHMGHYRQTPTAYQMSTGAGTTTNYFNSQYQTYLNNNSNNNNTNTNSNNGAGNYYNNNGAANSANNYQYDDMNMLNNYSNVNTNSSNNGNGKMNLPADSQQYSVRTKLYVTNFPEDMDQEEMKLLFNQYGQVLECTIMWNQYAFVHFGSYAEAEKALNGIKGTQYKGFKLSVQWSTSSKYQQPKQHQSKFLNQQQQQQGMLNVAPVAPEAPMANAPSAIPKILERPSSNKQQIQPMKATNESMSSNEADVSPTKTTLLNYVDEQPEEVTPALKKHTPTSNVWSTTTTTTTPAPSWASIMNSNAFTNASDVGKSSAPNDRVTSAAAAAVAAAYSNNQESSSSSSSGVKSQPVGPFKVSFSEIVRSSATGVAGAPPAPPPPPIAPAQTVPVLVAPAATNGTTKNTLTGNDTPKPLLPAVAAAGQPQPQQQRMNQLSIQPTVGSNGTKSSTNSQIFVQSPTTSSTSSTSSSSSSSSSASSSSTASTSNNNNNNTPQTFKQPTTAINNNTNSVVSKPTSQQQPPAPIAANKPLLDAKQLNKQSLPAANVGKSLPTPAQTGKQLPSAPINNSANMNNNINNKPAPNNKPMSNIKPVPANANDQYQQQAQQANYYHAHPHAHHHNLSQYGNAYMDDSNNPMATKLNDLDEPSLVDSTPDLPNDYVPALQQSSMPAQQIPDYSVTQNAPTDETAALAEDAKYAQKPYANIGPIGPHAKMSPTNNIPANNNGPTLSQEKIMMMKTAAAYGAPTMFGTTNPTQAPATAADLSALNNGQYSLLNNPNNFPDMLGNYSPNQLINPAAAKSNTVPFMGAPQYPPTGQQQIRAPTINQNPVRRAFDPQQQQQPNPTANPAGFNTNGHHVMSGGYNFMNQTQPFHHPNQTYPTGMDSLYGTQNGPNGWTAATGGEFVDSTNLINPYPQPAQQAVNHPTPPYHTNGHHYGNQNVLGAAAKMMPPGQYPLKHLTQTSQTTHFQSMMWSADGKPSTNGSGKMDQPPVDLYQAADLSKVQRFGQGIYNNPAVLAEAMAARKLPPMMGYRHVEPNQVPEYEHSAAGQPVVTDPTSLLTNAFAQLNNGDAVSNPGEQSTDASSVKSTTPVNQLNSLPKQQPTSLIDTNGAGGGGIMSGFNSYVLFPSESFVDSISSPSSSSSSSTAHHHHQLSSLHQSLVDPSLQLQFANQTNAAAAAAAAAAAYYPIEDVLANLIR